MRGQTIDRTEHVALEFGHAVERPSNPIEIASTTRPHAKATTSARRRRTFDATSLAKPVRA